MNSLDCGCVILANARSYSRCTQGHGPQAGNVLPPPAPGRKPPATDAGPVPTPRQAQKRRDAQQAGPALLKKPGRYVMPKDGGRAMSHDAPQDVQEPAKGPSGSAAGNPSPEEP